MTTLKTAVADYLGTRLSDKLKLHLVKTVNGTFLNKRIPFLWNNLPENLKTEDLSLSCFKKKAQDTIPRFSCRHHLGEI